MKMTRYAVLTVIVAGLLAACEFSGSIYVEPSYDEQVNAEQWTGDTLVGADPADEVTLAAGESIRYKVVLPSSSLAAVYYELDQPLYLTVYDRFNAAIASSRSSDFFRSGTLALSSAAAGQLASADVSAQFSCRGSCVIERRSGSPRFVRIHNPSAFSVTTSFYAILRDFEDTNEGSAPEALAFGDTDGALETIGDVDRYSVTQDGFVELVFGTLESELDYRLAIHDAGGSLYTTLEAGDPPEAVYDGEEIRVYAENGDTRAGAVGKSRYRIAFD